MILLDTTVVSEALKPLPHPSVVAWLDAQVAETLFLSTITLAELLSGIRALPDGRRNDLLAARIEALLEEFAGRILPFDTAAARRHAELAVRARLVRKGLLTPDGCIAAIAAAGGLAVIDPWTAPGRAGRAVVTPTRSCRGVSR